MAAESDRTFQDPGQLTPEHPDIIAAAAYSYRLVAEREGLDPEKVHLMRLCAWVTKPLRLSLMERGYELFPLGRELEHTWPPHVYLRSDETSRGMILVDGTWQQFIPRRKRDPALPKAIVGTPDEVVDFAKDAGVRSKHLDYWKRRPSFRVTAEVDERYSYGLTD